MSEANQGNNPDASAIVPLKRSRGHPRKYPKMEVDHEANAHVPGIQNLNHGENAHAPPGFGVVNSNQPHQVGPVVLQPVNLSNGALSASATNQTAHLVPSKGKQVLDAAHSSNGLTPTNEIIQFQSLNNHQVITSPFNQNPAGGFMLHHNEQRLIAA